jgi:predicted ATPase
VTDVVSLVRDEAARLVTLAGPGGTGKTRLAVEAAGELVREFGAGVFWIGLAPVRDPTLVVDTIAQTLGAKQELAAHIGEKQLLLLLDNVEQVIEAAVELAALLQACPNLRLLVTSRELLRVDGEVVYPVPALAEPDALELFCARARIEPDDAVAELCGRLDNLPLALELAAARVRVLTPAQILARISQRLDLFRAGRDADPRQQTLRATIAWSYDLLSTAEQRLFAGMAVFRGGCTLEAAAEVAEADLDTLQSLVEKSLLRFTDERYWMLETIHQYAREQLEASGEAADLRCRHISFFTESVVRREPDLRSRNQPFSLAWFRAEYDNIRAALDYTAALEDPLPEATLAGQLWYLWYVAGIFREGAERLAHAFGRAGDLSAALRAPLHDGLAVLTVMLGDIDTSRRHAEASLELRRATGEVPGLLRSLLTCAASANIFGDYAAGQAFLEELEALARAHGESWFVAIAVCARGTAALEKGAPREAQMVLEEGLRLIDEVGDPLMSAGTLANLASAELDLGELDAARSRFTEALVNSRDGNSPEISVWSIDGLAAVEAHGGDDVRAARLVGAAEGIAESIGYSLLPLERARHERTEAALLERMSRRSFDDARAQGHALDGATAIAYALDETDAGLAAEPRDR